MRWLAFALILFASAAAAQPSSACKVHDPELQGSYSGGCKDGLAEGHGEARGGAQYQGEFRAGRKHGKGVKTWISGDRYDGDYVDDLRHGTGTYVWGRFSAWSGQRYTGGFANDRRHGHGVYEWPNGERYAGAWENDKVAGAPTKGMVARSRTDAEREVSVGRVGARVCREVEIGVANREIIRGTVTAVERESISVRILAPTKHDHAIGGVPVRKDAVVTDLMKSWLPCV